MQKMDLENIQNISTISNTTSNFSIFTLVDEENNKKIGYHIQTELGSFNINKEIAEKIGISSIELKEKVFNTKEKSISNVTDMSNNFGMQLYLQYLLGKLNGITIEVGNNLLKYVESVKDFSHRECFTDIKQFLDCSNINIQILYGVRRTGKTVLLFQTIQYLLQLGVPSNQIAYITIRKNGLSSEYLLSICKSLLNLNVKYLFIDEITYCTGNLNCLTYFSDAVINKKIILSGTDSVGFLPVMNKDLYDRANISHTSYIPFSEYKSLYKQATLDNYIYSGGVLHNSVSYDNLHYSEFRKYQKMTYDYIGTSIVDNIFNAIEKYPMDDYYPIISDMYYTSKSKLKTAIYKWIQEYTKKLTITMLRKQIKSDDIGNLRDLLQKRDVEGNIKVFCDLLFEKYLNYHELTDCGDYSEGFIQEMNSFMKDLDCLIEDKNTQFTIIIPIAIRLGYTFQVLDVLKDTLDTLQQQTGVYANLVSLQQILLQSIQGVLIESIIYADLLYNNIAITKYRKEGIEVDIVIGSDIYEVKHSDKINLEQCKWLVHDFVKEDLSPKSYNIIYRGESTIITTSAKEIYATCISNGRASKVILNAYETASNERIKINYINAEEFLCNIHNK